MSNQRLSEHFHRSEFRCPCGCGGDAADVELLELLETIRGMYGAPVTVTSGYRCAKRNRAVGGEYFSYHLQGQAADIQVRGIDPAELATRVSKEYPERYAVIEYPNHVHVDVRDSPYRDRVPHG